MRIVSLREELRVGLLADLSGDSWRTWILVTMMMMMRHSRIRVGLSLLRALTMEGNRFHRLCYHYSNRICVRIRNTMSLVG
jgi:hypothetical protein